jgi:hypothetical protein
LLEVLRLWPRRMRLLCLLASPGIAWIVCDVDVG